MKILALIVIIALAGMIALALLVGAFIRFGGSTEVDYDDSGF